MRILLTHLIIVALLFGCTAAVTKQQIDSARYSSQPSEKSAESNIRAYFSAALKDPDSLRLECQTVKKGWARQYRDKDADFGWIKSCMVNAKNSFGGYTGAKPYIFLFTVDGMKVIDGSFFRDFNEHVGYVD